MGYIIGLVQMHIHLLCENPTISNVPTFASGQYDVVVTVDGCTSQPGSTIVNIKPLPAQPNSSNTSPVCAGQDFTLNS